MTPRDFRTAGLLLVVVGGGVVLRALGLVDVLADTPLRAPFIEACLGVVMALGGLAVLAWGPRV